MHNSKCPKMDLCYFGSTPAIYIEDYNSFNKEKLYQRNQIIKEISTIYTCEHPISETLNLSWY